MPYHYFRRPAAERAGRAPLVARFVLPAAVVVPMALLPAASGATGSTTSVSTTVPGATVPSGEWPYPNGDLANTRVAPGSTISSANVARLQEAWAFKLTGTAAAGLSGTGSLTAGPVVQGGAVYIQDQYANVYALSLATGKLMWEYQANLPEKTGPGPDGVAVADGTVYGDTSTSAFALNAVTGKAGLGGQQPVEHQPRVVRDPAAGGGRAGLPGQRLRLGAGRRGTDGSQCGQRPRVVEVQHRHPAVQLAYRASVSARAGPGRRRW